MKIPFLIGRIVFGGFFLYSGIHQLRQRNRLKSYVESKHVPMPNVAVTVSGLALIIGSTSILLGLKPKIGAAAVAAFLVTVSPLMHDFWNLPSDQQTNEFFNFTKNIGLLGAALALFGIEEPWPVSLPTHKPGPFEKAVRFTRHLAA